MGKVYTIEVGVDYPWVGVDDTFEVNVEFTDNELEEIIQGGIPQPFSRPVFPPQPTHEDLDNLPF